MLLGEAGEEAVSVVEDLRGTLDGEASLLAIVTLGRTGPPAPSAVSDLEAILAGKRAPTEPRPDRRGLAAAALCRIDRPTPERVQAVLEHGVRPIVSEPDDRPHFRGRIFLRETLVEIAEAMSVESRDAVVATLRSALPAEEASFRDHDVVLMLGAMGPAAAPVVPYLREALDAAETRWQAMLEGEGDLPPGDLAAQWKRLEHEYEVRSAMRILLVDALGDIGRAAGSAASRLEALAASDDPLTVYHAARALRSIRGPSEED